VIGVRESQRHAGSSAGRRVPRLVTRFAICTALGLATAAAVILVVDRRADTVQAQQQAIAHARFATEAVLKHRLRASDLERPLTAARRQQLDRLFDSVLVEGMHGATLFGRSNRVVFASQAGRRPLDGRYVGEALAGAVASRLGHAVDGTRVLQTYVPIRLGAGTPGVVLLEQRYADIERAAEASSWVVALVLEALLLLLLLLFVPLLARVTARIRSHVAELEHLATHDELMGLPNRRGFRQALESALGRDDRAGTLLLVDLDGFHEINDTIGSDRGDRVLELVAARLHDGFGDHAVIARLGEDEFGLLLSTADRLHIATVAEHIREVLAPPFDLDGVRVAVDASLGAALFPEHGTDFDTILRRAGVALSIAKADGHSKRQIYSPGHDDSDVSQLAVAAELREAFATDQLVVYFQPQADFSTRAIRGVEALIRWQHPERGLLAAEAFIDHAERSGLTRQLRELVLTSAARQWRAWHLDGVDLEIAVNLSPLDLFDETLTDNVASVLDLHHMPARCLILELTERTLIADERRVRPTLARLTDLGVRLSIDDFGTGNSSLLSLRQLPIRQVKLARKFLAGVPGNAADETIVRSTVDIAHALHATVVAEGIETKAQWHRTAELGCDIAQGYLIGRPQRGPELTARLLATRSARAVVAA
jgi:diguanylate cyclase (GGDEF)-like protein